MSFRRLQPKDSRFKAPDIRPLAEDLKKPKRYFENPFMFAGHSAPRVVVAGVSGGGKSTMLANLILRGFLSPGPDTITICAKSPFQPGYAPYHKLAEAEPDKVFLKTLEELDIDDPAYDPELRHVLLIDDYAANKKELKNPKLLDVFFRGRHRNMTTFITTQSFFVLPKEIRDNTSSFCLFKCCNGRTEVARLANALCDGTISKELFIHCYDTAIEEPYGFLMFDREAKPELRYRKGFTDAIVSND